MLSDTKVSQNNQTPEVQQWHIEKKLINGNHGGISRRKQKSITKIRLVSLCAAESAYNMTCFHPLKAWRSKTLEPSGKRKIVFSASKAWIDQPVELPCGQCIGCRLERSRQWAIRCVHESSLYDANSFITLTYDEQNMPPNQSLQKRDFQLFMKRLRKYYTPQKIRFFHCGEYGDHLGRPHYHAILFNLEFADKVLHKVHNGNKIYTSPILEKIWGKGFCIIGAVTFESAAYVARYVVKKINGPRAEEHYKKRVPEYTTMSRRPGIGKEWYNKFKSDVYPDDFVVVREQRMMPPRYYDKQLEGESEELYKKLKVERSMDDPRRNANNTYKRLAVREEVQRRKLEQLKRPLDSEEL